MSGISKRVSGSWVSGDYGIMKTATDTIKTLPADIYADGNNATVSVSGNMEQNGTPTPQNPIQPSECGDLETTGEHAGQYKIPISSASTTTPVYLGEVETTRRIKKYTVNIEFTITLSNGNIGGVTSRFSDGNAMSGVNLGLCDRALYGDSSVIGSFYLNPVNAVFIGSPTDTLDNFKSKYNGASLWYVLANEETTVVNEPLMKIGDYADTVSGITIPTIAGANNFDVLTTLKPSEVTVNYKGWHPVTDVHEKSKNLFDKDAKNVDNGYIANGFLQSDGSITTNIDYRASEYIKISQNQQYALYYGSNLNLPAVCFYDSAKNYISGVAYAGRWDVPFITPQNAEYLRLSFRAVDPASIMLNTGNALLPYEPYWK